MLLIAPVALNVLNAPVDGVVAPTVPLMFIDAVPVRFVTVPLAGVPRIAPLPSVATPVTPSVLLNVPVVAATDEGVVAPSVPFSAPPVMVGLVIVGEVENTRFVDVVPVAPAAVYPVILLKDAIPALVAFVPPSATVTGAVSENTVPVRVSPVLAVYDPAPENCDQGKAVVPSVPPAFAVQTQPVSALVVPVSINTKAEVSSSQVSASVVRVHAPAAQR